MVYTMSPYAAKRILRVLMDADLRYQLAGLPHEPYIRYHAKRCLGEAKRELLRVADLKGDIPKFIGIFIEELQNE